MESYEKIRQKKRAAHRWRVCFCVIGFLTFLGIISGCLWLNNFQVDLTMNGPQEITLEYGEPYVELGASAMLSGSYFMKDGKEVAVQTMGKCDDQKVGEYQISYSAGLWPLKQNASRTIRVVDTQAPVITLKGAQEVYVLPGTEYTEDGFSALDNYDGDLTDNVKRTVTDDLITYYVEDQSGNSAEVTRTLIYADSTPPDLLLQGPDSISIVIGTDYEEPGYSAKDNCDGDLTDKVTVEGAVDNCRPGAYTLTYSVQDSFGNVATTFRTVNVIAANAVETVTPPGKVIYLTFDDGPSCYTEKLLQILEKYDAKATFFVINSDYTDVIAKISEQGHSVGIHSATHDYRKIYASEDAFTSDLKQMQDIIYEKTGINTFLMRFPGGSSNTVSRFNKGIMTRLTDTVEEMGFQYFDWNVDSGDASGATSANQVAQNVISAVQGKDISIVLQHDSKSFSVDAVEQILRWGKENGYSFMALSPDSPCVHHGVNN